LGLIRSFLGLFSSDIALDLGTANTLVYVKEQGVVIDEPSVVALTKNGQVKAVGIEAKRMLGRTPDSIRALRPMRDGVIADFEVTEQMLSYFIRKSSGRRLSRPRVLICVPSGITEVEKRAVRDSALTAGAKEVLMVYEPMAAAIGASLPVMKPLGNIIVDIGGGTTEVALISLGGIVINTSIRVGGDELDESIDKYLRKTYNLLVGEQTAERIKLRIGTAFDIGEEKMEIRGRDIIDGVPRVIEVTAEEIRQAMADPLGAIVRAVHRTLERTPPELAADLIERGLYLAGGGALLRGFDSLLHQETGLNITVVDRPLTTVVSGAGKIIDNLEQFRRVLVPTA
jgi:rod shape-determining protein MreB